MRGEEGRRRSCVGSDAEWPADRRVTLCPAATMRPAGPMRGAEPPAIAASGAKLAFPRAPGAVPSACALSQAGGDAEHRLGAHGEQTAQVVEVVRDPIGGVVTGWNIGPLRVVIIVIPVDIEASLL